jgi:oligoribonuclease NrnB/cAMP/cGMP phosphodiesterase (DHH superfamily)
MRAPILFIYHGSCYDGFTAAWVFNKFQLAKKSLVDQEIIYHPAHYGEDPPDCTGKEVWLVDFSYPRDVMIEKIIKPSMRTVILDHHKTAEADLKDILDEVRMKHKLQRQNDKVVFDMHRSGAGILYDELNRESGQRAGTHTPSPNGRRSLWLVDYIEDRDLWTWKLPNSKEVSAFVSSVPMTFPEWDAIDAIGYQLVAEGGRSILRYIDTYGDKVCEQSRYEEIGGHRVPTINLPYMNTSDHVGKLAEANPNAPFAAGYFRKRDGTWQFSLRSRGTGAFDVSDIAKLYGGGGHASASGFQVKELPWADKQGTPPAKDAVVAKP